MPNLTFELATPPDDDALRQLLRQNPMPGNISVTFEREPSYFKATQVEGLHHQTIVVREQETRKIIGMGSRAIRPVYVNGQIASVGYLSQMRIAPHYRISRRAIGEAWHYCRQLHQDGRAAFYLSSIIADNKPAQRLLEAGLPGLPQFKPYTQLHTLSIYCARKKKGVSLPGGLHLVTGRASHLSQIVACLERNNLRYQLAPQWTMETLCHSQHTLDLKPENFFLVTDGGRVIACLAWWDQSSFKQTVVRAYGPTLRRWRPLLNLVAKSLGWPVLPAPHTPFRFCYLSHLAVNEDCLDIFEPLLRAIYNHLVTLGYSYFMLGLPTNHPFLEMVQRTYRHIDYQSQLYLVGWDEDLAAIAQVDERLPGVEIGVL